MMEMSEGASKTISELLADCWTRVGRGLLRSCSYFSPGSFWSSLLRVLVVNFPSVNLGNFLSVVLMVRNRCMFLGVIPGEVPHSSVELFSSAPPIINSLATCLRALYVSYFQLSVTLALL